MRTMMSLCIVWALSILGGMTYAADMEVKGDFRVTTGAYYYQGAAINLYAANPPLPL